MRKSIFLSLFFVLPIPALGEYERYPVVPWDGIQWKWPAQRRVVAVSDVHGDPDALLAILRKLDVIDENGLWKAGDTHLVSNGDILDRGHDSRFCLDYLDLLGRQAIKAGGRVHLNNGNHESLQRRRFIHDATLSDALHYDDYMVDESDPWLQWHFERVRRFDLMDGDISQPGVRRGVARQFSLARAMTVFDSPYAERLNGQNVIIQIGSILFVHADVGEYLRGAPPEHIGAINASARLGMRKFQDFWSGSPQEGRPAIEQNWILSAGAGDPMNKLYDLGPLWGRGLAYRLYPEAFLNQILSDLGVSHVVIGHTATRFLGLGVEKPAEEAVIERSYGDRVIRIDTDISRNQKGTLSALEILPGREPIAHNKIERPRGDHPIKLKLAPYFLAARHPRQAPLNCVWGMLRFGIRSPSVAVGAHE